ncbi:MAG: hypothetical protein WCB19_07340 [Thermoplasmata archaeon]
MGAPPVVAAGLVIVGIVLFVLGYLQLGDCGGGWALVLFGLGVYSIGAVIWTVGGPQTFIGSAIFGTALLIAGLLVGHGAGCQF